MFEVNVGRVKYSSPIDGAYWGSNIKKQKTKAVKFWTFEKWDTEPNKPGGKNLPSCFIRVQLGINASADISNVVFSGAHYMRVPETNPASKILGIYRRLQCLGSGDPFKWDPSRNPHDFFFGRKLDHLLHTIFAFLCIHYVTKMFGSPFPYLMF